MESFVNKGWALDMQVERFFSYSCCIFRIFYDLGIAVVMVWQPGQGGCAITGSRAWKWLDRVLVPLTGGVLDSCFRRERRHIDYLWICVAVVWSISKHHMRDVEKNYAGRPKTSYPEKIRINSADCVCLRVTPLAIQAWSDTAKYLDRL